LESDESRLLIGWYPRVIWTVNALISFEREIADLFNAGRIRAPVHLSGGNEVELIAYFKHRFQPGDWVVSTWRSHYHALLAGVPQETVKQAILAGRSITLCFPQYRFFSSAIVGGSLPIGLGIALGVKLASGKEIVHAFIGDMTERTGAFHEVTEYADGHNLPINFIVEDNRKSVMTETNKVWGSSVKGPYIEHHYYDLQWPHAGAGVRVQF